jgi:ABC-type dipeptide/oligopeptide/nickel transport system ATPase component
MTAMAIRRPDLIILTNRQRRVDVTTQTKSSRRLPQIVEEYDNCQPYITHDLAAVVAQMATHKVLLKGDEAEEATPAPCFGPQEEYTKSLVGRSRIPATYQATGAARFGARIRPQHHGCPLNLNSMCCARSEF